MAYHLPNRYQDEDVAGESRAQKPWLLIVLAVLGCAGVAYTVNAVSGGGGVPCLAFCTPVQTEAPVAYRGLVDCSTSMLCSEAYFAKAFGLSAEGQTGTAAKTDGVATGIEFQCPADIEILQVGMNDMAAPFRELIPAPGFGIPEKLLCAKRRKEAKGKFHGWIGGITSVSMKHPAATNILELLARMRRPTPEHRLRVVLATDAAQSTHGSQIDLDTEPLTPGNIDSMVDRAIGKFSALPDFEKAQIQFVLPEAATTATLHNSAALLESFWTKYFERAAPSSRIVNFSTSLKKWTTDMEMGAK